MIAEKIDKLPNSSKELLKFMEDNYLSPGEVINMVRKFEIEERERVKVEIPPYKSKPTYKKNSNSPNPKDLRALADEIEEWEKYEKKRESIIKKQRRVGIDGKVMEEFIRETSGLNKIPTKYRDKVYTKAWDYGHANGYSEVYHYLNDLVDIFS